MAVVMSCLPIVSALAFSLCDIHNNRFCTYVTDGITGKHIEINGNFINIISTFDGNFLKMKILATEKACSSTSFYTTENWA
jgi:hypothetical protein